MRLPAEDDDGLLGLTPSERRVVRSITDTLGITQLPATTDSGALSTVDTDAASATNAHDDGGRIPATSGA